MIQIYINLYLQIITLIHLNFTLNKKEGIILNLIWKYLGYFVK